MTMQKMAARARLAAGLAIAGCGIAVTAGTTAAGASPAARPVSGQDRTFMGQASQINLTEISLGRYMQTHAATTTAKKLGAAYAHDHTAAQANLRALASRLRVTLPSAPGAQLRSMVARVEARTGKMRDVAFAAASVSGHRAAIAIFRKEESAGGNRAVRAYASAYVPMLQTHLRLAEQAESVLRVIRHRPPAA